MAKRIRWLWFASFSSRTAHSRAERFYDGNWMFRFRSFNTFFAQKWCRFAVIFPVIWNILRRNLGFPRLIYCCLDGLPMVSIFTLFRFNFRLEASIKMLNVCSLIRRFLIDSRHKWIRIDARLLVCRCSPYCGPSSNARVFRWKHRFIDINPFESIEALSEKCYFIMLSMNVIGRVCPRAQQQTEFERRTSRLHHR